MDGRRKPRVALVLGSGGARGWAHIGVLHALEEAGIRPDLVCGTSIGALVGAAYASDRLDKLEAWVRPLDHMSILSLLDPGFRDGGFIHGAKLMNAYAEYASDGDIGDLRMPFIAVATDIETGREVWLREGPVLAAVRASIAIPGIFAPVCIDDRWLVDGGLVNPVPVSVARALQADVTIAVNLNGGLLGSPGVRRRYARPRPDDEDDAGFWTRIREWWAARAAGAPASQALFSGFGGKEPEPPGILSVMADAIDVMQDRITRARLAGEPPDVMISPDTGHIGMLEFDHADEAIDIGRRCAEERIDAIKEVLGDG